MQGDRTVGPRDARKLLGLHDVTVYRHVRTGRSWLQPLVMVPGGHSGRARGGGVLVAGARRGQPIRTCR